MLQRVHLDIQVGEHANNYAEIAAKDKLTELQLRVRQLVEQVDQIQKEQNYQRVSITVPVQISSPGLGGTTTRLSMFSSWSPLFPHREF